MAKQQQLSDKHSKLEQFLSLVRIAQRGSMCILSLVLIIMHAYMIVLLEREADAGDSCLDVCGECYGTNKERAREQAMINAILRSSILSRAHN